MDGSSVITMQDVLIVIGVIGVIAAFLMIVRRIEATTEKALPALDRSPRTATVVAVHEAPRSPLRSADGSAYLWMIEVEYADGGGTVRRESLADLFAGSALPRVTVGSTWQVYGFVKPQGRCLLTEAYDELPRAGYNLDQLRISKEQFAFSPRPGSPILGVMHFADDQKFGVHRRVTGRRTSWPGDPADAWNAAQSAAPIRRTRPVPPLSTTGGAAQGNSVLCYVYDSPLTLGGGDVDSQTKILVDVNASPVQAARIVAAFRDWARDPEARGAWGPIPLAIFHIAITSAELFGEDAAGGFIARDCPGEPGDFVLVSEDPESEYPDAPYRRARLTRIELPKQSSRRARR